MEQKHLFCGLFLWLCLVRLSGQTPDLVKPDSIVFPVHQASIGKIAFMEKVIPIESFSAADFLERFEWTEGKDLSIRVFMGNSLLNAMHRLAPELPAETLVNKGNFQFSFWVDDKNIYTENLHPGAFGAENKQRKTVFRQPLISTSNEDSWGRFMWNRFLMNGGQEALNTGEHRIKIEIRPYLKLDKVLVGEILATGSLRFIVPGPKIQESQLRYQRPRPAKGWKISEETIDTAMIAALNRKVVTSAFKDITGIVVVKDGKLLLEEYFNGAGRDTLHDTRSVGKSFASALLGLAIQNGYIKDENQPLKAFYPLEKYAHYSPEKALITLRQLLTMSAPLQGSDMNPDSPGNEENMYPSADWVKFALDLPLDTAKWRENTWDYFTAGVVVLGDVIQRSVPGGLETFADRQLFRPLGISRYQWQYTPQKVPNTAGSLRMRALDLAKFGQLYQNNGRWNGKQILPETWVRNSLSHQLSVSDNEFYGYLFWNKTYQVKNRTYEAYYAGGNGGNRILIFKDQPWVMVITATAFNLPYAQAQVDKIVEQYLISALSKN